MRSNAVLKDILPVSGEYLIDQIDPLTTEIVWQPIPDSSQELALDSRAQHTLYHGARGPGKTIVQLMRFRSRVGKGYGVFWRGVIFDVEYKHLADLVAQSNRFFKSFGDGAEFKQSAQEYKWVWPTGEELLFRHAKKLADYDDFHGHEYPFIGWNELTKYATSDLYDKMMSTNRSSFTPYLHTPHKRVRPNTPGAIQGIDRVWRLYDTPNQQPLPEIPLEVFSTSNPSGPGHNWVKKRFIMRAAPGELFRETVRVFDPKTKTEIDVVQTHVHIFGSWRENIYLSAQYIAELEKIKEPNLRRAWLYGDWDVTAGGAIDDLWNTDIHILPVFPVPKHWKLDRGFDWGSTEPFAVLWFAECNGEECKLPNGKVFCPPAGSIIVCGEWYGAVEIGNNKGLKMSATKIAEGIREREIHWMATKHFLNQPRGGPADNQIRNVNDVSVDTTETKMAAVGIKWTESDKSPGTNAMGLQLFRDYLEAAIEGEGKAIYFMRNCVACLELLPSMNRDEEKPNEVHRDYEKHTFDVVKYRLLAGGKTAVENLNVKFG